MAQTRVRSVRWLHTRVCPRCGYDGPELQGQRGHEQFECPSCGEDLYARKAMTYAEMEGFTHNPVAAHAVVAVLADHHEPRRSAFGLLRRFARALRALLLRSAR
jgi:predicted RNA-binding Zn-ribbon protein involved in translation (DUF1610 family)